jgi:hypothetical protein
MEHTETVTPEQIARHYSACLDSVALIEAGKPELMSDADWADTLKRNRDHLAIMLEKPYWTNEDLKPLQDASR